MKKRLLALVLALASTAGVSAVAASGAAAAGPSPQDIAWLQSNEQTNLAEITIGTLAQSKSTNSSVTNLANVTKSQHQAVSAKAQSLAQSVGVTLPSAPNPTQQAQAAQLQTLSGSAFDTTYLNDQIAGHQLSIAQTQTEIASGSDPSVIAFAKYYLPFAQMHLQMAQSAYASLTGASPTVGAGSGGMAATSPGNDAGWLVLIGAGGAVLLLSGSFGLRRRLARR